MVTTASQKVGKTRDRRKVRESLAADVARGPSLFIKCVYRVLALRGVASQDYGHEDESEGPAMIVQLTR